MPNNSAQFSRHAARDARQQQRLFALRGLCNYGRWSRDMQSPLVTRRDYQSAALKSAGAPRFEPKKKETIDMPNSCVMTSTPSQSRIRRAISSPIFKSSVYLTTVAVSCNLCQCSILLSYL